MVKAALTALACLIAGPASACRLALVLAVDVSSSVDAAEDRLQRSGLAAALIAPEVEAAFFASPDPVALSIFEWSGRYNQVDLLDWTLIRAPADLQRISARLAQSSRSHDDFPTAMGHALGYAAGKLRDAPDCLSKTVDMAGDGVNNDGFGPEEAYAAFPFAQVTVNGLVVNPAASGTGRDLVPYYHDRVIRGPGAFVEVAQTFADYQDAMQRKLVRELSVQILGLGPLPQQGDG